MTLPAALLKGWCPGALRPMRTGDGLLLRIRLKGARLDLDRAEAIADCAARFGNGIIEISSRANLQLRGVGEAQLSALQRRLDELGLLDADASAEGARNIVASPISDLDPTAIDIAPAMAALEARLADAAALHRLPPKFSFLVDGGGVLPLGDIEADVRFEAWRGEGGPCFVVTLAGADDVGAQCAAQDVPNAAAALAGAFLREAGAGDDAPRRMSGLVMRDGASGVFAAAGLAPLAAPKSLRRRASYRDFLGVRAFGGYYGVGAAPSLGRMTAADLRMLAREARQCSARDIRLTPWRALIVAGLERAGAQDLAAALSERGFLLDAKDPRLSVVACAGAPACANAARPVQEDALALAASIAPRPGIVLHVSGCQKGCAHAKAAPFTLVARQGRYDLVVNGKASDEPRREALSVAAAASFLSQECRSAFS
jgi:precorrin-3B synthase